MKRKKTRNSKQENIGRTATKNYREIYKNIKTIMRRSHNGNRSTEIVRRVAQ